MIWKTCEKSKYRKILFLMIGPLPWLALTFSIFLNRMGNQDFDFLTGFLLGFSMVGNLVYIFTTHRLKEEQKL